MSECSEQPTLFEWAGGRAAFERLIDAFYDRVERDELISPLFPGGVSREHRDRVIRLAMHNSQPGADVPQQAPVPHWGWGEAPPYQP
jgi:truncated hemoglobin YjbI